MRVNTCRLNNDSVDFLQLKMSLIDYSKIQGHANQPDKDEHLGGHSLKFKHSHHAVCFLEACVIQLFG